MQEKPVVSVVLPAYNEAMRLEMAVMEIIKALEKIGYDYEVIIAEDGSTDGTAEIAAKLADGNRIRHLHSDERLGKGGAILRAFEAAKGSIVAFVDVDLSTDLKHLKELIDAIAVEGYDIAIGSRLTKGSKAERPVRRNVASKVYNFLVRFMLGSKVKDHQCGFKAFKKDLILDLGKKAKDRHWFWDTEVLVLAQREGLRIKEIPVEWKQSKDSKISLAKDSGYMLGKLFQMWAEETRSSRKFLVFSIILAVSIIAGIASFVGLENVVSILLSANPYYITLAAVIYALSYVVRGERFRYIVSRLGYTVSLVFSTESVAISQTMNVVTPVRVGDVARAYVFRLRDVPFTTSISGLAVERIFDLAAVVFIAFVAIAVTGFSNPSPFYALAMLFVIVALLAAFSRMENILGRIARDAKRLMDMRNSAVIFVQSAIIWLIDVIVCYLVLIGLGGAQFANPVFLPAVMLAVSIANVSKVIPLTPGGIGTYEAVMTGIFASSMSGMDASLAFAVSLIDHGLKNLITLILGLVAVASLNIRLRELR
ncbi:flippase-like domain-containing protein [Archaeoglobus veneficus]|uniref:Glycosyl transferase family 2 n=1 Tax=Archaeoglobus veneficus (strain DSM 11195 / SNP6) TaxID=693661 RepID=F2KQZ0_ARCVS|nr:flippase-like domain-containing protein [Archaeoglobus veneficus]AEA47796.1 glycosyl transferase family 2 [Archaeoglobus veneficus SNP6]